MQNVHDFELEREAVPGTVADALDCVQGPFDAAHRLPLLWNLNASVDEFSASPCLARASAGIVLHA